MTLRDVENVVDAQIMRRMEEIINPLADAIGDAEKRCKYYADEIAAAARRDASVARSASMSSAESAGDFLRSMASRFGR